MSASTRDASPFELLATNLRVEGALLEALTLLEGLPIVVFKGTALTRQLYGDLRKRASADNDLFVPEAQAGAALERLLRAGYLTVPGLDAAAALAGAGQVALWPRGDFDAVSLDLHREPFSRPYFVVDEALLLAHLEPVELQGRTVQTFSRALAFAHLVAHFVQHHLDRELLPTLAEAWNSWQPELSGAEAAGLRARTGTAEAADYALRLAQAKGLLRAPVPGRPGRRASLVLAVWGPLRDQRGRPPRDLVRKALALYLASPDRLLRGVLHAALLRPDDLAARYGRGSRALLTARHVLETLVRR
jgi:hypothetical protein